MPHSSASIIKLRSGTYENKSESKVHALNRCRILFHVCLYLGLSVLNGFPINYANAAFLLYFSSCVYSLCVFDQSVFDDVLSYYPCIIPGNGVGEGVGRGN